MRFRKELIFIVLATLFTLTVGARIGLSATSCADIKNLSFTDLEFGKPITITSATIIAATATTPELCDVRGTIWPEIQFALKIPTTTWNERFMMVGTGGTAGMIFESSMPPYLKLGFAVVGTDTGHTAPSPGQGELWAIPSTTNPNADQKVKDYGYRANHEVPVLAKKIIEAYRGIKPRYSYWVGCSNGGREGLVSAQRYPTDFDGYLANSPPVNLARSMIGFIWKGIKFPNVSVSKLCLQSQYVFNKCDGLDGLVDGLIENPAACAFDPFSDLPSCPNDVDAANCFTLKQRTAIKDIYGGPKTSWGAQINVPLQPGAEVCTDPANPATSGWGRMATTINTGSSTIGYLILRDPGFDATKFSFDTDTFKVLDRPETEWMAADNPDLWRVKNRGGKIISVYGWAESQDPYVSLKYYNDVTEFMGWETVNEFYKLYFVPGMFHCGGGVGCSTVDWFTPLQNWVENGVVPKAVIGSRSATATLTARTRPICPYPEVARYKGSGSIDDAANFACVKPEVIAACDDIKKLSFTDIAFNKPVTITSTTIVAASATTPQYCDVRGTIWPEINFALKIPTTTWNERLMMVGSGGTAGSISEYAMPPYLQKGFAVVATDTGHKATPPGEPWALPGLTNPNADQKIKDYGYRANHEVSNLAKKIIKAYHGSNPRYSYWTGCSNGGREALVEAQRYPEDFDGILAGCGPSFFPGRMMGFIWNYNVWGPKVPTSKLCLQSKYVYDKCDGLDGLVDGLIENPLACEFDPMTELPACPDDVDGSDCWTIDQRTAINKIYQGPTTSKGQDITIGGFTLPGMPLGSEACTDPSNPATSGWMMYIGPSASVYGDVLKYLIFRDPTIDPAKFNFDSDPMRVMARPEASWLNAYNPDLSGMKAIGHKIIEWESWNVYSPAYLYEYHQSVLDYMGGEEAIKDIYRSYLVPGGGHCGGGIGASTIDWLTALQNWVEKDVAPETLEGSRAATATLTAITRPICLYPRVARYLGSGSIDNSKNFTCVEIIPSVVQIVPPRLNLGRTKTFSAIIRLPDGYRAKDWEIRAVVAQGAPAVEGTVRNGPNYFIAKFETADLTNLPPGEEPTITVSIIAEHNDQQVAFEGSDIVKIVE